MPLNKNRVIIASAGSGKTTCIVDQALDLKEKKILVTTYTNENRDQIRAYFIKKNGCIPKNVTVISWYSFLLQECVRPYQSSVMQNRRVESIIFENTPLSLARIKKTDTNRYYLTRGNYIYRDKVADFSCYCDDTCGGLVIKRLEKIYDYIFIDEVQDLAGYDHMLLEKFFNSSIAVFAVGDPRQATYCTNNSAKNRQYKKTRIFDWFVMKQAEGLLLIEERSDCHRCNQEICDFADSLFPQFPTTNSKNADVTGHDGIFLIKRADAVEYYKTYSPVVLRYNKNTDTLNLSAVNIGVSKGKTYERVLIFPTKPMVEYIKTKNISKGGDISKLYVAVTRAKYSVAFVI